MALSCKQDRAECGKNVFGGLFRDIIKCKCGYVHELPLQNMADIIPIQLIGHNIQSCIEAFFSSEEVDWKCPSCGLLKCQKKVEVICPPSTLILHLLRFMYDDNEAVTIKQQSPMLSPTQLNLPTGASYVLTSIINHVGEASDSGHYTIIIYDEPRHKFMLIDDTMITDGVKLQDMVEMSYVVAYTRI